MNYVYHDASKLSFSNGFRLSTESISLPTDDIAMQLNWRSAADKICPSLYLININKCFSKVNSGNSYDAVDWYPRYDTPISVNLDIYRMATSVAIQGNVHGVH